MIHDCIDSYLKSWVPPPPHPPHHHQHHHSPTNIDVPKLCVSFSGCCKVRHITMEMRGANGGSCRHDTPAQNSLLQEETEEPFSISSSLFSLPLLKCATVVFLGSPYLSFLFSFCPRLMLFVPVQTPTSSPLLPKWPLTCPKMSHLPIYPWNKGIRSHRRFLPHCASVQPTTGAGGEKALDHCMTELGRWCQAGVERGASPLGFSEAHRARGVLQVQNKQTTWEDREQDVKRISLNSAHLILQIVCLWN